MANYIRELACGRMTRAERSLFVQLAVRTCIKYVPYLEQRGVNLPFPATIVRRRNITEAILIRYSGIQGSTYNLFVLSWYTVNSFGGFGAEDLHSHAGNPLAL
jgi:hypothetical protein